jgi:hypothetical protein
LGGSLSTAFTGRDLFLAAVSAALTDLMGDFTLAVRLLIQPSAVACFRFDIAARTPPKV